MSFVLFALEPFNVNKSVIGSPTYMPRSLGQTPDDVPLRPCAMALFCACCAQAMCRVLGKRKPLFDSISRTEPPTSVGSETETLKPEPKPEGVSASDTRSEWLEWFLSAGTFSAARIVAADVPRLLDLPGPACGCDLITKPSF